MKENKSLSERINELEKKIEWFYSEDFDLEEAVENYKSSIELAKELQKDLSDLQNEIEVLSEDFTK